MDDTDERPIWHKVEEVLAAATPMARAMQIAMPDKFPFLLHVRCRRLYRATALLISEGFAEEGAIVARSLFSDSLRLGALALAAQSDRYALAFGWVGTSIRESRGLVETAVKYKLEANPAPVRTALDARLLELDRARARFGVEGAYRLALTHVGSGIGGERLEVGPYRRRHAAAFGMARVLVRRRYHFL